MPLLVAAAAAAIHPVHMCSRIQITTSIHRYKRIVLPRPAFIASYTLLIHLRI